MSIASLAQEEIIRTDRTALYPRLRPIVEQHLDAILPNLSTLQINDGDKIKLKTDLLPLAAEPPTEKTQASSALDALVRYVPTESITLYVAATAASKALTDTFHGLTNEGLYWIFVILTPILFLLIYVGKRLSQNLSAFPDTRAKWPLWKTVAATVAFAAWALAVPGSPYLWEPSGKIVAAFLAVFVSMFLTLLEPLFERPTPPPAH